LAGEEEKRIQNTLRGGRERNTGARERGLGTRSQYGDAGVKKLKDVRPRVTARAREISTGKRGRRGE